MNSTHKGKVSRSAFVQSQAHSLSNAAEIELETQKTYGVHNLQLANN